MYAVETCDILIGREVGQGHKDSKATYPAHQTSVPEAWYFVLAVDGALSISRVLFHISYASSSFLPSRISTSPSFTAGFVGTRKLGGMATHIKVGAVAMHLRLLGTDAE
jgi:hypothetical protein